MIAEKKIDDYFHDYLHLSLLVCVPKAVSTSLTLFLLLRRNDKKKSDDGSAGGTASPAHAPKKVFKKLNSITSSFRMTTETEVGRARRDVWKKSSKVESDGKKGYKIERHLRRLL